MVSYRSINMKFFFHSDPGHGWLQVPIHLVSELGLAPLISNYSYRDPANTYAYLEEDCDAPRFIAEYAKAHGTPEVEYINSTRDSFIRSLPHF